MVKVKDHGDCEDSQQHPFTYVARTCSPPLTVLAPNAMKAETDGYFTKHFSYLSGKSVSGESAENRRQSVEWRK
jgi:hypothetical protein